MVSAYHYGMATDAHYTPRATLGDGSSRDVRPDWSNIDTVLLDMDGTLLDLHFDNHFFLEHLPQRVSELHGRPQDEVEERLHALMASTRGTLDWYSSDWWGRQLDVDIIELSHETADRIDVRDASPEFMQTLKAMGKSLVLATNADRKVLNMKNARTGIDRYLESLHSSHDFGFPKEEQGFWDGLMAVAPFDPLRTLLIDDTVSVLRAAQTYGIRWLIAPEQPDSQRPPEVDHEFATIARFSDLLP